MLTMDEVRRLDRLAIGSRAPASSAVASGLRRARGAGGGLEFHDRRGYQYGDDPRWIDWSVEARLRQLVVRVFHAEANVRVHLMIDTSASMAIGAPDKLRCAARVAAALAYVTAERREAIGLMTFARTIGHHFACASGRAQLLRIFAALSTLSPAEPSAIDRALEDYATLSRGPGLAIVLSDFYGVSDSLDGLRALLCRGLTPAVAQIVADEEATPAIEDDTEIIDIEDPAGRPMVVSSGSLPAYTTCMRELEDRLRGFCELHGLPWLRITSSTSFEGLLAGCIRSGLLSGIT